MNIPHLDPVTLASFIGAAALGLTRLATTTKPIWDRLPALLQGLLPVLVLVLPQIAAAALGVHTSLDLVNLLFLAAALILPGVHSHTVSVGKPNGPGSAVVAVLTFCLSLGVGLACSPFKVNWPALGACADSLRPGLTKVVADILASNDNAEADLEALGETEGLSAVECAVKQLVSDVGPRPAEARGSRIRTRGLAFLATVPR